ncbi:SusC/RagA family TonB-linked outer membrane protein [Mucilaginibacter sp. KACC 22063]|uniref:SusC/RagA family TonB-linked outer membrane protein n=1 Tax=Mucilaginibacter sp. KACC 22063 TaxID=3025666 RepID=UPI0023666819|nr:TonB-dependent receptor [Mucilaginibacter sp. KACC 22063]WDF53774.1 TonB-dependent receptor [Mucilaginibacter sp. KACC 22063]
MRKKFTLFILLLLVGFSMAMAQVSTIKGKVTDSKGQPLPGVTIKANGTPNGTVTDLSGNFTLRIPPNASLTVSYIGYATQNVQVGGQTNLNITLTETQNNLNEVVVVGYGTQKKSVVTGAISSVGAKQLENQPINRIEQALQGRTSGVTILQNNGQPGTSSTVRVRGFTTFSTASNSSNDPLWVVDGQIVDNGGIGYINSDDIASIEVLKDAASAAIYGTRAANGVILVTTKKGKAGRITVSYNGFYGTQAPAKKLDLLNAQQYATIRNESAANAGKAPVVADVSNLGTGTDWQSLIFNNDARRQQHQASISGGSEKSTFFSSFGYITQDGIVSTPISKYNRANIRLNSTYNLSKYITVGENLGYSHSVSSGVGNENSEFGGSLSDAINLDPLTPAIETNPTNLAKAPYSNQNVVRNAQGQPYGVSSLVAQEIVNPLAYTQVRIGNYNWDHNFVGNVFATIEPIKGLKLNSSLGTKMAFYGTERYVPTFWLNSSTSNTRTNSHREMNYNLFYNFENTLSYGKTIGKHDASILLGQGSYMDGNSMGTTVDFYNVIANNFFQNTFNYKPITTDRQADASDGVRHKLSSLYARGTYAYDEKYLFTGIIRRDGSSRFGANNKYGTFPSAQVGWVPTRESFFPKNQYVNFLKIRGSYGVVGNDGLPNFAYISSIGSGRNYTYGTGDASTIGWSPGRPGNPDLKWEQTSQTNIGFDAHLLNDFTLTVDWYKKKTKGILQAPGLPNYLGYADNIFYNLGDMQNTGWEFELGYNHRFGDFNLGVNGNMSFNKNRVLYIQPGQTFTEAGEGTFQTLGNVTRSTVGGPMHAFYGYTMLGIFQTQAEIDSYTSALGKKIQPNAQPGDVKWADLNGDGSITSDDRSNIGSSLPTVTYGLTLNLSYKRFDFTAFGIGQGGNQIFQGLRRLDILNANYQTTILDRWTPSNPNASLPRVTDSDNNKNYGNFSKLYLQSGNFFRIKTMQLGYTFPKALSSKVGLDRLRVYVLTENLVTFTKYTGYDPEIGGGTFGIDHGAYPQARSFMAGVNIGF